MVGGLATSFELFKESKRQNSQGYSYSISVSNLENKGNVHETFCDSQICHLLPSLFTHTPISIYLWTSLRPLLERLRQKKPKKSERILSGNNTCVWAITALGKSSLDRLTLSQVLLTLLPCIFEDTPRVSSPAWQQLFHHSFYKLWKHRGKTTNCEARMIGNTLSAGLKRRKLHQTSERFFFCASHWGPHTTTDPWIKLLEFNGVLPCSRGKL